jgi:hypothetical protein
MVKNSRDILLAHRHVPARCAHAPSAAQLAVRAGGMLCLLAAAVMSGGCNDNTTTAAGPISGVIPPPPVIHAHAVAEAADPAALESAWATAEWTTFSPPTNARTTTPPTRAAILYDKANLYVNVVAHTHAAAGDDHKDTLSLFLDTHGDGREILEISLELNDTATSSSTDKTTPIFTWFRAPAGSIAHANEHGTLDPVLPVDRFPNIRVTGVTCELRDSTENPHPIKSAVLGIPLRSLPAPFQDNLPGGAPYKMNVIRAISAVADGKHASDLQSSLSPVPLGATSYPQRMADLQFSK